MNMAVLSFVVLAFLGGAYAEDGGGIMPQQLFDPADAAANDVVVNDSSGAGRVMVACEKGGLALSIAKGDQSYPGITVAPANGKHWALTAFGHVEATVTNRGSQSETLGLRVDSAGSQGEKSWNAEEMTIPSGESRVIRVYFGYSYGRKGYELHPEAVIRLLFFMGKAESDCRFLISDIKAAGTPGEAVGVHHEALRYKPAGGVLLASERTVAEQLHVAVLGKGTVRIDSVDTSGPLLATFPVEGGSLGLSPLRGLWDLGDAMQVTIRIRNDGAALVRPRVRLVSDAGGETTWYDAEAGIMPGTTAAISVPFASQTPWIGISDPVQTDVTAKGKKWGSVAGSGTSFASHRTSAMQLELGSVGTLAIVSATAENPPAKLPEGLGVRPPVDGEWTQTLDEDFVGDHIDAHRWNVHTYNWWDKRQHFSRDEVIVRDGELLLRAERKTGHHNDDPAGKVTDYAVGWADTYGKWTQRYGYFETRVKLPTAPCMWPAVWMMPDRGLRYHPTSNPTKDWNAFKARGTQDGAGMEFDIIEGQSIWGPHRFNIAMHWDGYGDRHKVVGSSFNSVQTDADGYIVVGMLWTPGSIRMFGNGREMWRWESPRVSNEQQHFSLQNQLGGWDTEALDDARLPADLHVDYIRVWQRADLASPDDGAKPNHGGDDAFSEVLE
jgi:beta-glucanase (GH16 family)